MGLVATEKIDEIDFPIFVAELIAAIFQARVDAGIQEIEAYGHLLQYVAKSTDAFRAARYRWPP